MPPIIGAWGSTETAPFSTVVYFETPHATNLGVPLPGTTIKLLGGNGLRELRVKGPNVTPGYWRQDDATAAAFEEDGFYRIGDTGRMVEPGRPDFGILYDGRVSENFKLTSGTWVNAGAVRLAVIAATQPLVADIVVTGQGCDTIGATVFPSAEVAAQADYTTALRDALVRYNAGQGSSTRIALCGRR